MKFFYLGLLTLSLLCCKQPSDTASTNMSLDNEPLNLKGLYKSAPNAVYVYDKLNFGNGYNSTTGKEHFGIMNYDNANQSTEVIAGALGNSGFVSMNLLETKEELKHILNINAKVDLDIKVGGFTSDNSAKIDLYKETQFNSFSQNAVLKAQYTNEPKVLLNPSIKEKWIALAKDNPDEFMRTCGDMFVSRIYTGGNMYALFSLHNRDSYEKEKNDFFLKSVNKYMGQKFDVEVSVSDINESRSKTENINTEIITEGGGDTPATSDLGAFIEYANTFKTQVGTDGRPVILYVQLSPYESIAGFPKDVDFSKIRVIQKEFLETCSEYFNSIETSLSNADFVIRNDDFFEESDIETAKILPDSLSNKITRLRSLMSRCESDFNDCDDHELALAFRNFEAFDPKMDYPEFVGKKLDLPIDTATGYVMVFPDTESTGKKIAIHGKLESRFRDDNAVVTCKDVYYQNGRVARFNREVDRGFWHRNHFVDIYEYYELPYYQIKYTSTETNEVLREFAWNGEPFISEKNVRVDIKLINRASKLQWQYNISDQNFDVSKWKNIGETLEKDYNFKRLPRFTGLRSCKEVTPYIIISDPNAKPEDVAEAISSKTFPKTIIKEGYVTYEYN